MLNITRVLKLMESTRIMTYCCLYFLVLSFVFKNAGLLFCRRISLVWDHIKFLGLKGARGDMKGAPKLLVETILVMIKISPIIKPYSPSVAERKSIRNRSILIGFIIV